MELYEELYKLEEKINHLTEKIAILSKRYDEDILRLSKEIETQKVYYSGHIKELYSRSQIAVK